MSTLDRAGALPVTARPKEWLPHILVEALPAAYYSRQIAYVRQGVATRPQQIRESRTAHRSADFARVVTFFSTLGRRPFALGFIEFDSALMTSMTCI